MLFFGGGALSIFGLVLVPMTDELNWSRSSLSLVLTTFMVVSALAMPLVGRIVDRTDLRLVLTVAVVLVGVGGVSSADDAYAKIRAGASLVQLYTALAYHGLGLIDRIKSGLAMRLAADGFASVADAVGIDAAKS